MTEGLLGSWQKSVGDTVSRGDIIAEVETDKATMGLEAFDSGILLEQRVKSGEIVPVGTVIGIIGNADEIPAGSGSVQDTAAGKKEKAEPIALPESGTAKGKAVAEPAAAADSQEKASPIVRRRARELGINLENFHGSGPKGRVLLEDLAGYESEQPTPPLQEPEPETAESEAQSSENRDETAAVLPLSRMRGAIARIVSLSWQEIPHFSVTIEIRMDNTEEVLRELKANGTHVSINEIVMKGCAAALLKYPLLNASFINGSIVLHHEVNIGFMAKVTEGLLVPVIKGCQSLPLAEIAAKSRQLIQKARNGTISETELAGGTFSVSNLGSYGVSQFSAIILPPQVAILAVGAVREKLVPGKGGAMPARIMKVTLSADHRVLDGVIVAEFLRELKLALENPVRLLL